MRIVTSLGHGMVPTIFWSADAEGVLREHAKHLDPDGCLVQQGKHRTYEYTAKAAEDTRLIEQKNRVWRMGATLARKQLQGGVRSLDKGLFMGTVEVRQGYLHRK